MTMSTDVTGRVTLRPEAASPSSLNIHCQHGSRHAATSKKRALPLPQDEQENSPNTCCSSLFKEPYNSEHRPKGLNVLAIVSANMLGR